MTSAREHRRAASRALNEVQDLSAEAQELLASDSPNHLRLASLFNRMKAASDRGFRSALELHSVESAGTNGPE